VPDADPGAIEALTIAGSDEQKAAYLPNLISGEWTGTMNLTEPSAGSDLAAVRSRAEPVGDGTYKIFGQKIFITWGEHDMTDNIVHLVLARTPNAPEGKGISLFVVPKFLLKADGTPGERNDVYCVSIEHKLGIHGSPTAVLAFGDNGGAIGTLVGEENRGLEYMFIMMNAARFNVGLEGLGDAERAYQRAVAYARDRVQGAAGRQGRAEGADHQASRCASHADVDALAHRSHACAGLRDGRRPGQCPLQSGRGGSPAGAGLCRPDDPGGQGLEYRERHRHRLARRAGAWRHGLHRGNRRRPAFARCPHHGHLRGTTAIQANDLIGRKIAREQGATIKAVIAEMRADAAKLDGDLAAIGARQQAAIDAVDKAVDWIVANFKSDPKATHAGAVPFLFLLGIVAGGWQMGRAAVIARSRMAGGDRDPFWAAKLATTRFFADHFLTQAAGACRVGRGGAAGVLEIADDSF
jgi:hypothetical protein